MQLHSGLVWLGHLISALPWIPPHRSHLKYLIKIFNKILLSIRGLIYKIGCLLKYDVSPTSAVREEECQLFIEKGKESDTDSMIERIRKMVLLVNRGLLYTYTTYHTILYYPILYC
jgi:hypothetical protein